MRRPGTEAKAAIESKIAGFRAGLADVLTNRRTHQVRGAGLDIIVRFGPHSAEAIQRLEVNVRLRDV